MSDTNEQFSGAGEVRPGMQIDRLALQAWMHDNVADFAGGLIVEQFRGGQSNPTYKIVTPARAYVLRRRPPGETLQSAHAVDREFRVMSALSGADFPVPSVYGYCGDEAVIGTPFYLMEFLEGRVIWDPTFGDISATSRRAHFTSLNETLARLHQLDYLAVGLESYGRPTGYVQRQIERWSRQYRDDAEAGRIPAMDRMIDWLREHIPPEQAATIVHGDYSRTNVLFHPEQPVVRAVLDWELSTIGDPLSDLGYHLMMYWLTPEAGGHAGLDLEELGIPSLDEYVELYCRHTGRRDVPNIPFYVAFNLFRLAAITHGIRGRVLRGNASSAHAEEASARLEFISDLAWRVAQDAR